DELAHVEDALLGGLLLLVVATVLEFVLSALGKARHHLGDVVTRFQQFGLDLLLGLALVAAPRTALRREGGGASALLFLLLFLFLVQSAASVLAGKSGQSIDDAGFLRPLGIDIPRLVESAWPTGPAGSPIISAGAARTAGSAVLITLVSTAGPARASGTAIVSALSALISSTGPARASGTAVVSALATLISSAAPAGASVAAGVAAQSPCLSL